MSKVKCKNCDTVFELTTQEPTVVCPTCGKVYKNPAYQESAPNTTNVQVTEPTPTRSAPNTPPTPMSTLLANTEAIANQQQADDSVKCETHKHLDAVEQCDKCGAPICEICYDNFTLEDDDDEDDGTYHFCADCYKEFARAEGDECKDLKRMVIREFVGIFVGMAIGLILSIIFILDITNNNAHPALAAVGIYAMFLGGSFITIAKKLRNAYSEERTNDTTTNIIVIIFGIIFGVMISPIVTIYRIVARIIDYKNLNKIQAQNDQLLQLIDEFIAQTLSVVAGMDDAIESGGEEVNIDFSLNEGTTIGENGEILRAIRTR